MLPPALKRLAQGQAREEGVSLGELIRRALSERVENARNRDGQRDPFFTDAVVFAGETPADLSESVDDYLYGDEA